MVPVDERETPTRTGLPRACAPRYFVFPSLTSPLSLCPRLSSYHLSSAERSLFWLNHHHQHHHHHRVHHVHINQQCHPISPSWTSLRLSWPLYARPLLLSLSRVHCRCPSSPPFSLFFFPSVSLRFMKQFRESVSLGKYQRRAGDLCMGWS